MSVQFPLSCMPRTYQGGAGCGDRSYALWNGAAALLHRKNLVVATRFYSFINSWMS